MQSPRQGSPCSSNQAGPAVVEEARSCASPQGGSHGQRVFRDPASDPKRKPSPKQQSKKAQRERTKTKQAKVIAMLKRPAGATIEQIVKATDWQPHTVRGFFAGALKKRLGIEVTSDKSEKAQRVYRNP